MAEDGKIWKDYKKIVKVGEGAFGDVYKAKHRKSGHLVAVKKIRIMKNRREEGFDVSAVDEIRMLQGLDHENIVTLHEILAGHGEIALVLDFLQTDLEHIIKDRDPTKDPNSFDSFIVQITPEDIKAYMRMLLLGLDACHSRFIMHRDLKPGNLLLSDSGVLKLGDFGLARTFGSPNARFSPQAITRWYRPLELLLGGEQYGPACDMWSVRILQRFVQICTRSTFRRASNARTQTRNRGACTRPHTRQAASWRSCSSATRSSPTAAAPRPTRTCSRSLSLSSLPLPPPSLRFLLAHKDWRTPAR